MPIVDNIIELLEDGRWHDLNEVKNKIELPDLKVKSIIKFLAQFNFINLDKDGEKAKLDSSMLDFLKKIQRIEEAETC